MKAQIKPGYEKNRVRLADQLPLATPFTLYITPSHICNFKCTYCTQSWTKEEKNNIGFETKLLEEKVFAKIIEQVKQFPNRFKQILFTGLGEPLLNPKTPDMIAEFNKIRASEKIEMYTNGTMLDKEMTHKLVNAGLTRLRISIQGIGSANYEKICGVKTDFDTLVSNIRYFYKNRGNTLLYIKIIDSCLENEEDKKKFYEIFGDICDEIYIEHLVLSQPTMGDYNGRVDESLTLYGEKMVYKAVCPLAFYVLQVDVLGNVFPCTPLGLPKTFAVGNVNENPLIDIWNGKKLKELRVGLLEKRRSEMHMCGTCQNYLCITHDTDNLDYDIEDIIERINKN